MASSGDVLIWGCHCSLEEWVTACSDLIGWWCIYSCNILTPCIFVLILVFLCKMSKMWIPCFSNVLFFLCVCAVCLSPWTHCWLSAAHCMVLTVYSWHCKSNTPILTSAFGSQDLFLLHVTLSLLNHLTEGIGWKIIRTGVWCHGFKSSTG